MIVRRIRAFAVTYEVDRSGMSIVAVATFTNSHLASLPGGIKDPGENAGVSPVVCDVSPDTQTFDAIIKVNSTGMIPQMT